MTVSYFEWVQNIAGYYWDLPTVHERLDTRMTEAFWKVANTRDERKIDTRMAAYCVAVQRVAEACKTRGWVADPRPLSQANGPDTLRIRPVVFHLDWLVEGPHGWRRARSARRQDPSGPLFVCPR